MFAPFLGPLVRLAKSPARFVLLAVLAQASVACSCSDDTATGGSGGATGGSGGNSAGGTAGSANGGSGGAAPCITTEDCAVGTCVSGACCPTPERVCGATCCSDGSVCLFDACVTPGDPCHTSNDCPDGQYCETALGEEQMTMPGCLAPVPTEGRCLDLPPVCTEPGNPPGCVEACEYHPPVGQLQAIAEWTWGPTATNFPEYTDVWSTPAVGRLFDGNCDGAVDELDSPSIVFVSGRAIDANTGLGTCCQCTGNAVSACKTGVLRVLDGRTGAEIWSLDKASDTSTGFSGLSVALGDIDDDGVMDILAVTGEGYVVMLDGKGTVLRTSDVPIPGYTDGTFGWGGGLAIADMDNDGAPEIAYGSTVFTTKDGAIKLVFTGAAGTAGPIYEALSTFADLDGAADNHLELVAGRTAYRADGTQLWNRTDVTDGFPAIGNLDADPQPEVVVVAADQIWVLDGLTGQNDAGPLALPGNGFGGPPTIADFDGDGTPEIGVAQQNFYTVLKPNGSGGLTTLWSVPNHDLSSSVTGSSVFDFEGDGRAEVLYADECFLWVFDGETGAVRFSAPHTSFTATETSLVADVDGDGHAEIIMVSNGANPSNSGWKCLDANNNPTVVNGVAWTPNAADPNNAYRGLVVYGDSASSWVGTRTLWNQHTYHVSNICDARDTACDAPNVYGSIPTIEKRNWTLPWLNNFRQNVQDGGLFDAPDATVTLSVDCGNPLIATVSVRNIGLSSLPAGVEVAIFANSSATAMATTATTRALFPGQTEVLEVPLPATASTDDTYVARIQIDPQAPKFHECRDDNNESAPTQPACVQ
ncbi:MAG: VCBS repeat-containing protein [Polyangiaceae bacterium]